MFNRIAVVAAFACLAAPTVAFAQSWYLLDPENDSVAWINRDSVRWREGRPEVDLMMVMRVPTRIEQGWQQAELTSYRLDCAGSLHFPLSVQILSIEGRHLTGGNLPSWVSSEPLPPKVSAIVCRNEEAESGGISGSNADLIAVSMQMMANRQARPE